ncbi:protein translocase subunit SecE [Oxobacter pfennigii]|uniref:Protein translocase subunit SecE n=1 Tax=Oxobacter pfennigii TaxID=36849 RepID=A0A0P9AC28_9CLOT|nr:protein translocase subunit SecE [Oxobacter pfennigii]
MALEAKAKSEKLPKGMSDMFKGVFDFVVDSKNEFKRITWPDKDKVIRSTSVVLTAIVLLTCFVWLLDSVFNLALSNFLKLLK